MAIRVLVVLMAVAAIVFFAAREGDDTPGRSLDADAEGKEAREADLEATLMAEGRASQRSKKPHAHPTPLVVRS